MPKTTAILECLRNVDHEWKCRIIDWRTEDDGVRYFKLHWKTTKAPKGNKWGVKKISWKDSWEPEEHVSGKLVRRFLRKERQL
jgi:hypothetical protein